MASYRGESDEQQQTHSHERLSPHLIYLPPVSAVVRRRAGAASRAGESRCSLISRRRRRRRRKQRSFKGAEVISSASGLWQEKIKCLHLVRPALFQMQPLPFFKRPLWARMANERFWIPHNLSFFSLPLPFSIPFSVCDANPKSLPYFFTVNVKVQGEII